MVFEVPDYKKSIDQNVFEVKIGSKVYKLPRMDLLSARQASAFNDADEKGAEEVYEILDGLAKGLGSALFDLPVRATQDVIEAWSKDANLTPGESPASED